MATAAKITLVSTATHLPTAARKHLLAWFTPLASDSLPEPANLQAWWKQVEAAIESLDPSFVGHIHDNLLFTAGHVAIFGPAVLGMKGWQ